VLALLLVGRLMMDESGIVVGGEDEQQQKEGASTTSSENCCLITPTATRLDVPLWESCPPKQTTAAKKKSVTSTASPLAGFLSNEGLVAVGRLRVLLNSKYP